MMMSAPISRRTLLVVSGGLAAPAVVHAQTGDAQAQEGKAMRLRFTFADQDFTATLEDNPSARELVTMLPLDLTIGDYSSNEKIAYLPRKLTEDGGGRFGNEAVGDLCYYAPWGNLAMFYGPYHWSRGLIRLGRFDQGAKQLSVRGEHKLRVEAL
ncbi:cyclophilin-like fold protein [Rhizobium sp. SYY.PMSO]|uniref:cyclophilin-like fold protein n=1 Tax=Rhizobium sp. SYY.PMSO TaxID=3382192 RepID=UPI0039903918